MKNANNISKLIFDMPIEVRCDRKIPEAIKRLTAHQVPEPIHLRLVTMHIMDFEIERKKNFSKAILTLISKKNARVSLLVSRKWISNYQLKNNGNNPPFIQLLQNMGVKVMSVRNIHAKIVLLHAGRQRSLLLGSANLSPTAMHRNHEANIYINNSNFDIIDDVNEYITDLYKNAKPV